jgi:hypothetical protein
LDLPGGTFTGAGSKNSLVFWKGAPPENGSTNWT